MDEMQLELDEWIVLHDTDVERYGIEENSIDEIILTNKNLIFIYDYKASLFSKSIHKVEMISLEKIKVVDGKVQVMRLEHDDYGNVMQIIYTDGCRDYISFNDDKKTTLKWIKAINKTVTGDETLAEEETMKKVKGRFSVDNKGKANKKVMETLAEKIEIEFPTSSELKDKDWEYIFCVHCGEKLNKGSRFCSACGNPVNQAARSNSQRQQEFVGKIYKCPNCGSIITNTTAICPDCGMKISKVQDRSTLREFQEKLIELESSQKGFGILNMYKEIFLGDKNPIEALIKNYPIPDTVDEIVEFMIYASTNIDSSSNRGVELAWLSKMKQLYTKARMSFPNTSEFKEIKRMYFEAKEEYE